MGTENLVQFQGNQRVITLHFTTPSNARVSVEASPGESVMEAARARNVEGIDAECGGGCSCATCHVLVSPRWLQVVGPPGELEAEILGFEPGAGPQSRLSCQIRVTDMLDGMELTVAPR